MVVEAQGGGGRCQGHLCPCWPTQATRQGQAVVEGANSSWGVALVSAMIPAEAVGGLENQARLQCHPFLDCMWWFQHGVLRRRWWRVPAGVQEAGPLLAPRGS